MELAVKHNDPADDDQQLKNVNAFNAYAKKLGLYEKNIHEKYLGTIFTRQQKYFNEFTENLNEQKANNKVLREKQLLF